MCENNYTKLGSLWCSWQRRRRQGLKRRENALQLHPGYECLYVCYGSMCRIFPQKCTESVFMECGNVQTSCEFLPCPFQIRPKDTNSASEGRPVYDASDDTCSCWMLGMNGGGGALYYQRKRDCASAKCLSEAVITSHDWSFTSLLDNISWFYRYAQEFDS